MKKLDKIIIIAFLVMASLSLVWIKFYKNQNFDKKYVEIKVEDKIFKSFELQGDTTMDNIIVKSSHGTNIVTVNNGEVNMIDADCPDQLCVKSSPINSPGENIVCLPHKVIVEIKGTKKTTDIDIISE